MSVDAPSSSKQEEPLKTLDPPAQPKDDQIDKSLPERLSPIQEVEAGSSGSFVKKLDFESREEFPESYPDDKEVPTNLKEPKLPGRDAILYSPSSKSRRGRGGRGRHLEGNDTMDRHLKRKAASDNETEASDRKKVRKSDSSSDSESINSTESQPDQSKESTRKLSAHTLRELSRLQVDMVADQVFPTVRGRRRSKQKGDDPDDHTLRSRPSKSSEREVVENEQSQELLKKRRRRSAKPELDSVKKDTSPSKKLNSSTESDDKSVESAQNDEVPGPVEKPVEPEALKTLEKPGEISDHDEVVESSQEPTVLRSPQRRLQSRLDSPSTSRSLIKPTSPIKQKPDTEETFLEEKLPEKLPESKKPEDPMKSPGLQFATAVLASSSPQSSQRKFVKVRSHGMSPHGRGAHMLGLISGASLNRDKPDDDKRESEVQRSRPPILKQTERVSSPSGSRQAKIFNNMKVADFSPAQSPFCNLKNDGEKVSPKMDKPNEPTAIDHDYAEQKDIDISASERELPMLEWSSANPPSLTASPSFSILKRRKSFPMTEPEPETVKRKRVSFADPPVSKEMGYVVQSPSKLNRSGIIRLAVRKDTPLRLKPRPKLLVPAPDTSVIEELESLTEVDLQRQKDNELLAQIADDLEEDDDVNFDSDTDDPEDKVFEASPSNKQDTSQNTSLTEKLNITDDPKTEKAILNITDDSILGKILTEERTSKDLELEETLDIQNLSRFNSSANSDELFLGKVPRTSTQLAAIAAAAEADTLPITDSMFLSQTMSQCSQGTQNSISLPVPDQLDSVTPICHTLIGCEESLNCIIDDLTNPLWVSHLANWFKERGLKTIGDLAKMSEKQIADIPTKGNPKALYVKEVLEKFAKVYVSRLDETLGSSSGKASPKSREHIEIIEETIEVAHPEGDDEDTLSATSEDNTTASISLNSLDNSKNQMEIDQVQTQESNDYGSMIINSMSPPAKTSTGINISNTGDTLSADVSLDSELQSELSMEELLEQMGPRGMEDIGERQSVLVKGKGKKYVESNGKKYLESTGKTGKKGSADDMLKTACSEIGLDGVLSKLPEIYSKGDFISKMLGSYKKKITVDDVKELDAGIMKQAVRESFSGRELCDLTSLVFEDEEQKGIPGTWESLERLLKRIPSESIASFVGNSEIVPCSLVLEVGLKNNKAEVVADAVSRHPKIVERVIEIRGKQSDEISKSCASGDLSCERLRDIFATVADQMSSDELLEGYCKAMKKKIKE